MTDVRQIEHMTPERDPSRLRLYTRYLVRDRLALAGTIFLIVLILSAIFGPAIVRADADKINFIARNAPPLSFEHGWAYVLGADTLGRPILLRLIVGTQFTLGIAAAAVGCSMTVGAVLGLIAGYSDRWYSHVIMRMADVIMSFPSLLMALIILYTLGASAVNLIVVLAITRIPVYLRTTRAEVLELRQRMFVSAARAMNASTGRILVRHIAPLTLPTLTTIAAIDFATVILAESSLSFLGLGIQPPQFTWGAMVAAGRGYLASAWWIAFWPGLIIILTTLSLNLLSRWLRTVSDPKQRWRLQALKRTAQ